MREGVLRTLERKLDPYQFIDYDDQNPANFDDDHDNSSDDNEAMSSAKKSSKSHRNNIIKQESDVMQDQELKMLHTQGIYYNTDISNAINMNKEEKTIDRIL